MLFFRFLSQFFRTDLFSTVVRRNYHCCLVCVFLNYFFVFFFFDGCHLPHLLFLYVFTYCYFFLTYRIKLRKQSTTFSVVIHPPWLAYISHLYFACLCWWKQRWFYEIVLVFIYSYGNVVHVFRSAVFENLALKHDKPFFAHGLFALCFIKIIQPVSNNPVWFFVHYIVRILVTTYYYKLVFDKLPLNS